MTAATRDLTARLTDVDARAVTTLRFLAADAVEAARSGHPGMPMGCAPLAWALWSRHLRHDPSDPSWPDRDRFVLSAGHGSALQYALLHLFGYDLDLDDLRAFRQLGSRTPGHPEYGHTPGVEVTTGPLGQGLATGVGMALAERMLAARFGDVVDHRTWVVAGDGCLMEGISHEAASLAGHLRLGRLVVLYDDNGITIDGSADLSCSDDVLGRFRAYGWHASRVEDGDDVDAIDAAIRAAVEDDRPGLVAVRTVIGFGAPGVEGTSAAHGAPLGADVLAAARRRFGWTDEAFHVPADVADVCARLAEAGARARHDWADRWDAWEQADPPSAQELRRRLSTEPPADLEAALADVDVARDRATRQASADVVGRVAEVMPELVGGSADLAGSTGTAIPGGAVRAGSYAGRVLHFGIREHAMAAALNGMALHGGLRVFGSTFLVFSDYLRPALRLSALMRLPVVYVLTHDSVGVGEDGPTHQPVEHVESLRLIPGLTVLRPADASETVDAWRSALRRTNGPTVLVLSRQGLPALGRCLPGTTDAYGARVVDTDPGPVDAALLASGSEVGLAVEAAGLLRGEGLAVRVVSVPWRERLERLDPAEQAALLGHAATVAVEAGSRGGWVPLTGSLDRVVGMDGFGASGSGPAVLAHFGFTPTAVAARARRAVAERRASAGTPAPRGDGHA